MTKNWKQQDSHREEEAQKYDRPVPSREYLLSFLKEWGAPIRHPDLCRELKLDDERDIEAVRRRLIAMCRDGQLISNRKGEYGLIEKMNLIPGRVIGHRDGFGFLKPDDGSDDLFLSPRNMRELFDGDRALVQQIGVDPKGRREGKVVEVLEHNTRQLVGRIDGEDGFGTLIPENQRITAPIMVMPDPENPLRYDTNQLVCVEIRQQPTRRQPARGVVVEVLGDRFAPGMEIKVAIHNHDIPCEWPEEVLHQIRDMSDQVKEEDKFNRIDLRDRAFVTIDGEDARDFDDAVYCEKKRFGGWRLWVAIADVSYYVRPDTPLDREAVRRGNSVYFPEHVVPMLPELLSNGLCSLNPNVDRLAMICEMSLNRNGELKDYHFYEGIINSKARLTYTKVGKMLLDADGEEGRGLRDEYSDVLPHIEELHKLYKALRKNRDERGAMDFETTETRIVFSDDRKIERIVPVYRNDAHKIIEECMLCANVATASFLEKLKRPVLFRNHEGPKESKLTNLRAYLGELGLNLPGGDKPDPKDYLRLSETIKDRPDRHIIQMMMLRSMQQAVYSPENKGHFGLAYPTYTHFTSPIRRYPDLLVHRVIRSAIHSHKRIRNVERPKDFVMNPKFSAQYTFEQMLALGEHCSMTERRADDATREVVSWLKCEYMRNQAGEVYEGVISAVTGFGCFVELDDLFVEGLVHITSLPNDYYNFEVAKQRLVGERTRQVFKLGDRLTVRVVGVNLDERKIDFEPISAEEASTSQKKRSDRSSSDSKRKSNNNSSRRRSRSRSDSSKKSNDGRDNQEGGKSNSSRRSSGQKRNQQEGNARSAQNRKRNSRKPRNAPRKKSGGDNKG